MNAVSNIFPNAQRRGCRFTSANLGGPEFRPLVYQKTTKTRTRQFTSGWSCFSDCRVAFVLPSDDVGTAFHTDAVALLEIRVAVLLILHLRFC